MNDYIVSYAQNREDIILKGFFKGRKKGFYVDVGAYHPTVASVTKIFYDSGWSGINIEPNKTQFRTFKHERSRDINLQVGVSDVKGELTLREYPEGLSTFSNEVVGNVEKKQKKLSYKDYKVKVTTLKDIFKEHNVKTIDFMKIDVEGFEYEVIRGNDWERYRPLVLCIEADHIIKDWRQELVDAKYDLVFFDGLNEYYVAKEQKNISSNFSYVQTMLLGKPILPAHFKHIIELNERLFKTIEDLQNITSKLTHDIETLNLELKKNKRIRSVVKQFFVSIHKAIIVRIENLNRRKIKKFPPLEIANNLKAVKVIQKINTHDQTVYFDTKITDPLLYVVVRSIYTPIFKLFKASGLFTLKAFRRIKHG